MFKIFRDSQADLTVSDARFNITKLIFPFLYISYHSYFIYVKLSSVVSSDKIWNEISFLRFGLFTKEMGRQRKFNRI